MTMDETNNQSDVTPDGGSVEQVSRAEVQRVIAQRDDVKAKLREAEQQLAALKATQAQKPEQRTEPKPESGPDISELLAEVRALKSEIVGEKQAKSRSKIIDEVLAGVPDGNRKLARIALTGMAAEGTISFDGDNPKAVADAAAEALRTNFRTLFVPAGSSATAIQIGPDGKVVDWSSVLSESDVPPGAWADMPPEVFKRITNGNGQSGALKLLGG